MKIVAISDTHCYHRDIKVPEGEILIHAGDATSRGTLREISDFATWFSEQPHALKLFIPGNHDFLFEDNEDLASQMIEQFENCFVLIDDECVWDGVKFYGSPWTPAFGDWAFMEKRGAYDMEISWDNIPDDTDVLITHGPPYGILDVTTNMVSGKNESVGCELLRKRVNKLMPKIHIFGHIHGGYGNAKLTLDGKTTNYYNASICNDDYNPTRPATEIEVK